MSECLTKSADESERAHYGLAVCCARRFIGRGVPREELIGEAEAALLWAAARFDETRGTRFSTYAIPFVLDALREACRRAAPMRVPRAEQRLLNAAHGARVALHARLGREPTLDELSAAVGIEAERLGEMLAAQERMKSISYIDAAPDVAAREAGFEDTVLLRNIISGLGRPYAQVLWLRFGAGCTQAEVARRLGVSQPRLSRMEARGKELLRDRLDME